MKRRELKLVSMDVKKFYGKKNWAAITGGENGESDDDFLQDSATRMKVMSLMNFPLVIHLVMTAVILLSFCMLIFNKCDQNKLTILFICTKIPQHYLVFCISDENLRKIGTATVQSQRSKVFLEVN